MIPQYEPSFDWREVYAVAEYMESGGWLTEYKQTEEFERRIATFFNPKHGELHCIVVNNGTISLSLALMAVGIGIGDEVIVPDLTMIATPNAVKWIGAIPVFVDVDPKNLCMDLMQAREAITAKTKAVIYVSLNGRTHDEIPEFKEWLNKKGIVLIEDAAQSFGSKYSFGKYCGEVADVTSFSFSMPKIITTGQGGCLVTADKEIAKKLRKLKDFGRIKGGVDIHDDFGINSKFTEIQAVIGITQMSKLHNRMFRKQWSYYLYKELLKKVAKIEFIPTACSLDKGYTIPWFVDIYVEDRDSLADFLKENDIGTRPVYPPIHKQKVYDIKKSFPIATKYSYKGLWLPSSFDLKDEQIANICTTIKRFYL